MNTPAPPPRIIASTQDELIATWQRIVVVVYRIETTLNGAQIVQEAFDELASVSGGAFVLVVVEESAPFPTPDVRARLARFLSTRARQIILSGVVYEGSGFRASAVRSLVSGLALVSALPYRHKIFATVAQAAEWFASSSPVARAWGPAAIADAVRTIRSPALEGDGADPDATG